MLQIVIKPMNLPKSQFTSLKLGKIDKMYVSWQPTQYRFDSPKFPYHTDTSACFRLKLMRRNNFVLVNLRMVRIIQIRLYQILFTLIYFCLKYIFHRQDNQLKGLEFQATENIPKHIVLIVHITFVSKISKLHYIFTYYEKKCHKIKRFVIIIA